MTSKALARTHVGHLAAQLRGNRMKLGFSHKSKDCATGLRPSSSLHGTATLPHYFLASWDMLYFPEGR
jgi:hypothetical protein